MMPAASGFCASNAARVAESAVSIASPPCEEAGPKPRPFGLQTCRGARNERAVELHGERARLARRVAHRSDHAEHPASGRRSADQDAAGSCEVERYSSTDAGVGRARVVAEASYLHPTEYVGCGEVAGCDSDGEERRAVRRRQQ